MRKVAIYGKGGIGKSTTTQNTVRPWRRWANGSWSSGATPRQTPPDCFWGASHRKCLDTLREEGEEVDLEDIRKTGFKGTVCVESGGPEPGVGCAGRGIITSINLLEQLGAY